MFLVLQCLFVLCLSNVGLGDLRAVDLDVDLGVLLLLLLLLFQRPPVADEVERQQVSCGAESQESDVDLEEDAQISKASSFYIRWRAFVESVRVSSPRMGLPAGVPS